MKLMSRVTAVLAAAAITSSAGTASAEAGDLLMTGWYSNDVVAFDAATGALRGVFVPPSSGLNGPEGLAIGPDGNLYVASQYSNEILMFDLATGAFLGVFSSDYRLGEPRGIAFGRDGNLYVACIYANAVARLEPDGTFFGNNYFVEPGAGGLVTPHDVAWGPDGNLYVSSRGGNAVMRYDGASGAFIDGFVEPHGGGLSWPHGIAFGPDGNLYVSSYNTNQVLKYAGDGTPLGVFAPLDMGVELAGPHEVEFRPDGTVWVANFLGTGASHFDAKGVFLKHVTEPTGDMRGPVHLLDVPESAYAKPKYLFPLSKTTSFTAGDTILVKFKLVKSDSRTVAGASAKVRMLQLLADGTSRVATPDGAIAYDPFTDEYWYKLSTAGLPSGQYLISTLVDDARVHVLQVSLL